MRREWALVALLPIGALVLPACSGKKRLDDAAVRLVRIVAGNDAAAFRELAHPALAAKFPPDKLKVLSAALARLGKLTGRSMTSIRVQAGGAQEGAYLLSFERGTSQLELGLAEDKLIAFEFKGPDVERAITAVRNAAFEEFKIGSFAFVDDQNKPRSNIYRAGDPIRFRLEVWGLRKAQRTAHVKAALRIVDPNGAAVLDKQDFIDQRLQLEPDAAPVSTITGKLQLTGKAGTYRLVLDVADAVAKRSIAHQQALVLE